MNNFGKPSADLDFGQSISTCLKKYAVFEGRASKSEFWPYFLVYTFGSLILDVSTEATQKPILGIITLIVSLGGMLPMISVGCRRMHDINKSGWFQAIPIYNLIVGSPTEGSSRVKVSREETYSRPHIQNLKKDITDDLKNYRNYMKMNLSEAQFKKKKKIIKVKKFLTSIFLIFIQNSFATESRDDPKQLRMLRNYF